MSEQIKTWQERTRASLKPSVAPYLSENELSIIGADHMKAEIAELRAALAKYEAQMLRMATCAGEFARDACVAQAPSAPVAREVPPLPELETLADMERLISTPADWDPDYRSIWQKLQVAERNKMQWRAYALGLRAMLAATPTPPLPGEAK